MKNHFIIVVIGLVLIASCKKEQDPFLITAQNVGLLSDSTQVKDIETIFVSDSIVSNKKGDEFTGNSNDIEIYEKSGKLLLVLTPFTSLDSTSTIKSIKISDNRYKTLKGISTLSTFKDIRSNYKITKIQNTLSNVVISVDEINAYFTIDKKELPSTMRYDMSLKIEAIQIPDDAKIKNFFIHWF